MGNNNTRTATQAEVDEAEVRRRVEEEMKRARRRDARTLRRVVSVAAMAPVAYNMLHDHQYQGGLAISIGILIYVASRTDSTFRTGVQNTVTAFSALFCLMSLVAQMLASTIHKEYPNIAWWLHATGYMGEAGFLSFHAFTMHICNEAELKN
ncbi:Hypothetical protein, putative [Bodo saltans]|uniref:Transmembrane protein n=1 Tax=Bodo saltans TaxID=75058 RepID=A0A0S4IQM9_BODSA|nr:Hypothetical protein, putative [Bodo saltans]|eukprot:CUF19968.1 Hypothetical protein, putative [Bodo saltans]